MSKKKPEKRKLPHYSLHHLIVALSYWGTTTRVLLIAFLALAVSFIRVLEQVASSDAPVLSSLLNEGQLIVYSVGSFAILDIGYVMISRAYSFAKRIDVPALLLSETVLALLYFLPYLAVVSDRVAYMTRWVFVAVLVVLALRLVVGMLYGKTAKK